MTYLGSLATLAAILGETHSSYYSLGVLGSSAIRHVRNQALHLRESMHTRTCIDGITFYFPKSTSINF